MNQSLIDKVKSRGYWRINFQPTVQEGLDLVRCKTVVVENTVRLRGWDYPHIPSRNDQGTALEPHGSFYQGWIEWGKHIEFWRMYQSGQFLHYIALREDWLNEGGQADLANERPAGSSLGLVSTVYQITEIFEFLSRLANAGLYKEGIKLSLSLNNTKDRALWIEDSMRVPFMMDRKAGDQTLEFVKSYDQQTILEGASEEAVKVVIYFFERFGWDNPNIDIIKKDQEALLKGFR